MVRDPGNRFTENVSFISFVEKNPGSRSFRWDKRVMKLPKRFRQQWNHQVTCAAVSQHFALTISSNVILQVKSCFQDFQLVFSNQQDQFSWHGNKKMIAQALCTKTGMKWAVLQTTGSLAPNMKRSCQGSVQYFNFSLLSEST